MTFDIKGTGKMAKFEIAEEITGANEGLYANNPADTGGETWAGVARKHWPKWLGWTIIDQIKAKHGKSPAIINKYGKANSDLTCLTKNFYKQNFWDVNRLDDIKDQQVANSVYDFGVNSGTSRAAKYLQEAVNNVSNSRLLVVDGAIGPKTILAANAINPEALHKEYNRLRGNFYASIAKGSQVQFLKGWLRRLTAYRR